MEKPRRGETGPPPFRSKRLYCVNGQWYFDTREGDPSGPYKDEYEARIELALHISLADATGITGQDSSAVEPPRADDEVKTLCSSKTADVQHESGDEPVSPGVKKPRLTPQTENVTYEFLSGESLNCSGSGMGKAPAASCVDGDIGQTDARTDSGQPGRPLPDAPAGSRPAGEPAIDTVQSSNNVISRNLSKKGKPGYIQAIIPTVAVILLLAVLIEIRGVRDDLEIQRAAFRQTIELFANGVDEQRNLAAIKTSINALARLVKAQSPDIEKPGHNAGKYAGLPNPATATVPEPRETEPVSGTPPQANKVLSTAPETGEAGTGDPVADTRVDAAEARVPGNNHTRSWIINLITLQNRKSVDRLVRKAEELAIPVEVRPIKKNEKSLWQLRVQGFASKQEASDYARNVEKELDLPQAWISSSL